MSHPRSALSAHDWLRWAWWTVPTLLALGYLSAGLDP